MYLFFLILLLLFFVIISVVDARKTKKLLEVPITEKVRIKWYNDAIIWGWIPVFAVLIICFTTEINFADIGLKLIDFNYTNLFSIFILVLCGVIFVLCLYQVISYVTSSEYREEIKKKLADNKDKNQYGAVMDLLIPRSKKEKGLFFVVALTAGISEEMLLRGFLYFLIIAVFPEISIVIRPLANLNFNKI